MVDKHSMGFKINTSGFSFIGNMMGSHGGYPGTPWIQSVRQVTISNNFLRNRRVSQGLQNPNLTHATRAPDTKGKSSIEQGGERYSTIETRSGKGTKLPGHPGFQALDRHSSSQQFLPELSQMYKDTNTNIGYARRDL